MKDVNSQEAEAISLASGLEGSQGEIGIRVP